jgi:hypothetical protein
LLQAAFPLHHLRLEGVGPVRQEAKHHLWLLADQDCDLAWRALTDEDDPFLLELRPVYTENPPANWGIRSQTLRLDEAGRYLRANSPNIRVTPEVVAVTEHLDCLDSGSQRRLKTWLGLRYDRPAIPERYSTLSRALAAQLSKRRNRRQGTRVRDVLAQFRDAADGATEYSLVAVVPGGDYAADDPLVTETRRWLAEVIGAVPSDLGVAVDVQAYGDEDVSLGYVESSFSLDLSALSWPQNTPGPVGEV